MSFEVILIYSLNLYNSMKEFNVLPLHGRISSRQNPFPNFKTASKKMMNAILKPLDSPKTPHPSFLEK